jgi:hypothetical protein
VPTPCDQAAAACSAAISTSADVGLPATSACRDTLALCSQVAAYPKEWVYPIALSVGIAIIAILLAVYVWHARKHDISHERRRWLQLNFIVPYAAPVALLSATAICIFIDLTGFFPLFHGVSASLALYWCREALPRLLLLSILSLAAPIAICHHVAVDRAQTLAMRNLKRQLEDSSAVGPLDVDDDPPAHPPTKKPRGKRR